ncbi:MAG: type III pantothenate kinase [Cellvibrionaceae bacterium]
MILEFDLGNTNLKWRLRSECRVDCSGSFPHNGEISYDDLLLPLELVPEYIHVVSVLATEQERFSRWCHDRWGVMPQFAVVTPECEGVRNAYDQVLQMGPDRWAALIAAYKLVSHDCLVVDSGSACTLDLVLANGRHLGGYIVPGLELMRDALFRDTDRVKLSAINYDGGAALGRSTNQAVSSGLQLMLLGLVSIALDQLIAEGAKKPVVMLTGGGAKNLMGLLESYLSERHRRHEVGEIMLRSELVFEGLPFVARS